MPLLEVKNLHTFFTTKKGIVKAVNDVSYSLEAGKTIGIVGESGSGKSVSAMSILRLLDGNGYIESGEILMEGRDLTKLSAKEMQHIRGNDISVIFQEPMTSLNPVFSVDRQLSEPFIVHQGMSKAEAHQHALQMLYDVQIPNPEVVIKQYPHQLSGGMRQRVMIAMALACKPKILIADEPTTALDVTIQAQILRLIRRLQQESGAAVVLITHDMGVVAETANDVLVLYAGCAMEAGPVERIFDHPLHPYTRGLLASIPQLDRDQEMLNTIEGTVPPAYDMPTGCHFCPRCPSALPICEKEKPRPIPVAEGGMVACWLYEEASAHE